MGTILVTERLIIKQYELSMAETTQKMSVEQSNRRFISDEVFETLDDAKETIEFLISSYKSEDGPFVYAILLKENNTHIGHIEAVKIDDGNWEIGYHIGEQYQNCGYATEVTKAFTPYIVDRLGIDKLYGICKDENVFSCKVLEKCGYKFSKKKSGHYLDETTMIRFYVWQKETSDIKKVNVDAHNIDEVTKYMCKLNNSKEHNIGYCGQELEEIRKYVNELLDDGNKFIAVYENDAVCGVMGYEEFNNMAEIWGPFVKYDDDKVLDILYKFLRDNLKEDTKMLSLNINSDNIIAIKFAEKYGFTQNGSGYVMSLSLDDYDINKTKAVNLQKRFSEGMINLHDNIFKHSYYDGKDIIGTLDKENKVCILKVNKKIVGYTYYTLDKEFNEGAIEFIGVDESYRNKGYARELLKKAFNILKKNDIDKVTLWVDVENKVALEFYKRVGFKVDTKLSGYKQTL